MEEREEVADRSPAIGVRGSTGCVSVMLDAWFVVRRGRGEGADVEEGLRGFVESASAGIERGRREGHRKEMRRGEGHVGINEEKKDF